jgi:hypothetical protein
MNSIPVLVPAHSASAAAIISGPLFNRSTAGPPPPRVAVIRFSSVASTSPVMERSTSPPRHHGCARQRPTDLDRPTVGGRVEPEVDGPHTMFGPVADGTGRTVEDPTRLRRRFTTMRRPSTRHSRWIFLWLTV